MFKFIANMPTTVAGWLYIATTGLMGMVIMLIGVIRKNDLQRITKVEQKNAEIEKNYIQKFDEVKTLISDKHEKMMKAVNDLHIDIAENYVRKSDMRMGDDS